jgi:NAD(P)-dependent dehydrogenase (short-subunit alcohol dehydrogenase family)
MVGTGWNIDLVRFTSLSSAQVTDLSHFRLQSGKAIIVTGGNRGIGLAISRQVAQAGGHVAVVYHSSEDAPDEAEKIAEEFNVKTKAYQVDTSDAKAMHELVHKVYADLGPVGGLVANAGVVSRAVNHDSTVTDTCLLHLRECQSPPWR